MTKKEVLSIFEVLWKPDYNRAIIAVVAVMLAQQLCGMPPLHSSSLAKLSSNSPPTNFLLLTSCHTGINSIIMYGVSLLADLLKSNSALLNIFVSILNVIVTLSCAPLADIVGRKVCILASIAIMGSSSILLAIGIKQGLSALSAISVLAFVAGFGLGLGPVPFILSS